VISEVAVEWSELVTSWLNDATIGRPDSIPAEDAYALFQTLAGAWPLDLAANNSAGLAAFAERVAMWRQKSLREAKLRSSWAAPDTAYEDASAAWLQHLLDPNASAGFLEGLTDFVARIAPAGAVNSVVQAVLRCTWPGIPDLYQGAELWDFSLVDPDNRRPVDYAARRDLLANRSSDWPSGAVKQSAIAQLLHWRLSDPDLFSIGSLSPLAVRGARSNHILAFAREREGRVANVAVMLHVADPVRKLGQLPAASWWQDTAVLVRGDWQDAASLFSNSPVFVGKASI
jgi:(1->4)-alpha-D-glucan 1-alpha-D-glucosylmutase